MVGSFSTRVGGVEGRKSGNASSSNSPSASSATHSPTHSPTRYRPVTAPAKRLENDKKLKRNVKSAPLKQHRRDTPTSTVSGGRAVVSKTPIIAASSTASTTIPPVEPELITPASTLQKRLGLSRQSNACCESLQKRILDELAAELELVHVSKATLEEANVELRQQNVRLREQHEKTATKNAELEVTLQTTKQLAVNGNGMLETLQKKQTDEHKINAQMVIFNRSLKTQVCELEEQRDDLERRLSAALLELTKRK